MAEKFQLLIVDDDALNARTLAEIFRLKGFLVDEAQSGEQALVMSEEVKYDCVLSDIRMEGMNGVELLRAMKARNPRVLFILMTAYTNDDLIMEGIRDGALITLVKPLDIDRLITHVHNVLTHNRVF